MASDIFPWYSKIRDTVAPTEQAANLTLLALVFITILIIWKGNAVVKAAWAVYLVSP